MHCNNVSIQLDKLARVVVNLLLASDHLLLQLIQLITEFMTLRTNTLQPYIN